MPVLGELGLGFAQNCSTPAGCFAGGCGEPVLETGYATGLCTLGTSRGPSGCTLNPAAGRRERNIMGLRASGCPREGEGSREDQTAPTPSTASHLCPKTSWAAITEQERFVSLAQVWREGTSICFCEGAGRFVVFPIKLTLHHSTLIPSGSGQ